MAKMTKKWQRQCEWQRRQKYKVVIYFPEIGKVKDNDDDKDDYNAKDLFKDKKWLQTFSNCRFPR